MNKRKGSLTRRRFATIGMVAGLLPIPLVMGFHQASAGELPRLDEGERSAKAPSYVLDASRMDSATRGGADRNCRGCRRDVGALHVVSGQGSQCRRVVQRLGSQGELRRVDGTVAPPPATARAREAGPAIGERL